MKKTFKIRLPKCANIRIVETNKNNGVLEVTVDIEQKYVLKVGDIVSCNSVVAIYAGTNESGGIITYARLYGERLETFVSENTCGYTADYHPATEAEKQRIFDALAKKGKRWNAEKKCIEDLPRWRAKLNGNFYYINELCCFCTDADEYHSSHNEHYNIGNYFRTREAAEKVASQIRDIFKNSKAE